MEEDCVAALLRSLGLSAGGEFSSEDLSLLFSKVFHVSSDISEAHAAMKKIAGGDNSWSCSGHNVLDVLLEMERERERKELLYWDFQLLNTGNLHGLTDHQNKKTLNNSESGPVRPSTSEPAIHVLLGTKKLCNTVTNTRRLRKAATQRWARLISEGVRSTLPSPWQGQRSSVKPQAWGCVSLSDILLLVEVKYDVVAHLVYREMLQEHHTERVWEMLSPWQQREEAKMLEDLAEEALESVDMLQLADLPGAFKIYKFCSHVPLGTCLDSMEQSWSAISFLHELYTFCQEEKNTLTVLGQRLGGESLRLLCFYIQLGTYRAQRERASYSALLAARQSWETWPQVVSPCKTEQVALWLRGGDEEEKEDLKTLQQKTELQLLVLHQEQERKHLLIVLHGISEEDLHESDLVTDSEEAPLRSGCIRRIKQIHSQLQTQNESQILSRFTNIQLQVKENCSRLIEYCAILLLTHLIQLQEVQAASLLKALLDRNAQSVKALRDKYEAEIEAQRFTDLLHLLMSDDPLTSGPAGNDKKGSESSYDEELVDGRSAAAPSADSISSEQKEGHTANASAKQEVCSGCGAVMEDLPYLEISCAPDMQSRVNQGLAAGGGVCAEEESSAANEQQQSLITLAWSKPPEDDTDHEAETVDGGTEHSQDGLSSTKTQIQSTQCEKTVQEGGEKELVSNKEPDGPDVGEVASDSKLQTQAMKAEKLQDITADSSEITDDLCSGVSDPIVGVSRETTEVELCPTESSRRPEHTDHEDLTPSYKPANECSFSERNTKEPTLMEREQATRPVSAMEREKTMRNLVDVKRKFEEKHQRDKERQFLKVQERLWIIQNRKAEEDLLGLKNTDQLRHLTRDLPVEDKNQQKMVVRERLEQVRRERSYVMQSKRDRNTAGFKELLAPVRLHGGDRDDETN